MASVPNFFLSAQNLVSCEGRARHPQTWVPRSALGFEGTDKGNKRRRATGPYRLDGGLERVRRREVGLDACVDAEAEGVVGLADVPLHAAALHRRRWIDAFRDSACASLSVARTTSLLLFFLCGEERKLKV